MRRQWITLGLLMSGGALATLAVTTGLAWARFWPAIFTGARLTSPLGCDCGVAISFWQHPWLYGLGVGNTVLLVSLTVWLGLSLAVSWKKTSRALQQVIPLPTLPTIERQWVHLNSEILPTWWPTWIRPQLQIIQDNQPRAMSAGLIHPTVFCSSGALQQLTEAEIGAILTHELMHIRRGDQLLLWLIRSWTSALPAQLKDVIRVRLTEYIECQTDQEAAEVVGRGVVGSALLSVAAWEPTPIFSAAAHLEGVVETRLQVLAGWLRSPSFPWRPVAVFGLWVASALVTVGVLFTQINTVYGQELRSPACLEAESVVVVNKTLVLYCPRMGGFEESVLPMSPLE